MKFDLPYRLPRYAFSARDAARAGDLWRLCQEAATEASGLVGWPPTRYRTEGIGFIVREMTCVHHRETAHGEPLVATTWVRDFRRGMITTREVRIHGPSGPLASATQEWVHVKADPERKKPDSPPLKPARGSPDLLAAFVPVDGDGPMTVPERVSTLDGPVHTFTFDAWHVWMDPLHHANHPMYVDWAEEALARVVAARGGPPLDVVPVAERVHWRAGVGPAQQVTVGLRPAGRTAAGDVVLEATYTADGTEVASATLVRRLRGGGDDLARLLEIA